MDKKARKDSLFQRATQALDLPTHALANTLHVELFSNRELRIENHRGILSYDTEEIHISGGQALLKIQGTNLKIRTMTGIDLLVTGTISGFFFE